MYSFGSVARLSAHTPILPLRIAPWYRTLVAKSLRNLHHIPRSKSHINLAHHHLPHHHFSTFRPVQKPLTTKSQLLSEASNRFSRLLVHVKWPLLRNNRPFSADDFLAFISWLVMGNVLWIVLGTTTFGLVTMYSIHTYDNIVSTILDDEEVKPKDTSVLGYLTGRILSQGLGIRLEFKNGSMPEWKDGMLKFKDVNAYSKDFAANIRSLNVLLSFNKWYEGRGLIYELEINGMSGRYGKTEKAADVITNTNTNNAVIDQSATFDSSTSNLFSLHPDYELNNVKIHDAYIEVFGPSPLKISVFNCDLPKLRGCRLLIDFFNANNVTGAINDSMFTIHKHQNSHHNHADHQRKVTLKLDGINMGSFTFVNPQLKFNWIISGKADINADISLPDIDSGDSLTSFSAEYKRISGVVLQLFNQLVVATRNSETSLKASDDETPILKSALAAIYLTFSKPHDSIDQSTEYVLVDFKVKLRDLKASLPKQLPVASSTNIPFVSLPDLRSLITYVNENQKPILINTTVIERLEDLYDLHDLSQTGLFDAIVGDIYHDLLKLVKLEEKRIIDQKSSLWSHSVASQLLLLGLGVIA